MSVQLEVSALETLSYDKEVLSSAVSFNLHDGEFIFLRGENGSGKSTLLKVLLGLHPYYHGTFCYSLPLEQIQYLPQLGNLGFHLPLSLQDMLDAPAEDSLLLKNLDLRKKWNTASGGERQKVLLASLLAKKPRLLILDEPFNHVDQDSGVALEKALVQFLQNHPQSAMILVSHRSLNNSWERSRVVNLG